MLGLICESAQAATPEDKYVAGDHYILQTDAYGFLAKPDSATVDRSPRCAGRGTGMRIVEITDENYTVRFDDVKSSLESDTCGVNAKPVDDRSTYTITKAGANGLATKQTGLTFGTLVVPFKFRLGSNNKLVSSSTIAPYLGWRYSRFQGYGTDVIPVMAAGLALVPITNPVTGENETKTGFSTAFGLTLTNVKSANFSAGILVGRDFLSKSDHALDASSKKVWISIWLGLSN